VLPNLVDPDARDIGVALGELLRIVQALGLATAVESDVLDRPVRDGLELGAPSFHDLRRGVLETVVEQRELLHIVLLRV
jgi:hypothetical protein